MEYFIISEVELLCSYYPAVVVPNSLRGSSVGIYSQLLQPRRLSLLLFFSFFFFLGKCADVLVVQTFTSMTPCFVYQVERLISYVFQRSGESFNRIDHNSQIVEHSLHTRILTYSSQSSNVIYPYRHNIQILAPPLISMFYYFNRNPLP